MLFELCYVLCFDLFFVVSRQDRHAGWLKICSENSDTTTAAVHVWLGEPPKPKDNKLRNKDIVCPPTSTPTIPTL